jgi:hypothetical protein
MPPKPPGGQGGPCSAFANPTLWHKQSCGQDAGRVPSSAKGQCSSGIYGSNKGQQSQGANAGVSSRPQRIWLGCVQPLLQDECVGPFPQLTCVRSALFWPCPIVDVVILFVFLVCVLWFDAPLTEKREKAL